MSSYNQQQSGYPQQPQQQPYSNGGQYPQGMPQQRQQYVQQAPAPVQQPQQGSLISGGSKVLYTLLGVFCMFIGVIVLLCSDKNVPEGVVREKLKWLVIGGVITIVISLLFFVVSAITGGVTYSATMY